MIEIKDKSPHPDPLQRRRRKTNKNTLKAAPPLVRGGLGGVEFY
jgi:hypothetical protein